MAHDPNQPSADGNDPSQVNWEEIEKQFDPELSRRVPVPEGVIPQPEKIEVPQDLQPATGLKGLLVNGRRSRKAAAYREGYVIGRKQAIIQDPHRLAEMSAEGSTGSSTHRARVHGHVAGYNATPPRQDTVSHEQ